MLSKLFISWCLMALCVTIQAIGVTAGISWMKGRSAEMASAFSGARKNRLDLSVGIALGSASQIALFVAPVLVLLSYVIGPAPMTLQFWPGAVVMMLIAAMTASLVTNSGRSAWFVGVLLLMVYLIFAMTLYLLPPQQGGRTMPRSTTENSAHRAYDVSKLVKTGRAQ